jgi:alpha-beta hydrolase superfamily lysophospholipase
VTRRLSGLGRAAVLLAAASLVASPAAGAAKKKKKKAPEPTAVPRPPDPYRVTITTSDGVSLAASWRPVPDRPQAPAVLLLHDFSRERREWEALAPDLTARGLATLAIDLRAHGESVRKAGSPPLKISPRLQSDPNGFPRDVEAACRWLRERAPKVAVLGLSTGGNLAVIATASRWAGAAVAVSANIDRLNPLAGTRPKTARATLFLAAQDDPRRAASARAYLAAAEEPKEMLIFPGAAHNLALLAEKPEAKAAALDWLAGQLGSTPLPTPAPSPTPAVPATPAR